MGSYDQGQRLGAISNLDATCSAGNCLDVSKLDPHHSFPQVVSPSKRRANLRPCPSPWKRVAQFFPSLLTIVAEFFPGGIFPGKNFPILNFPPPCSNFAHLSAAEKAGVMQPLVILSPLMGTPKNGDAAFLFTFGPPRSWG